LESKSPGILIAGIERQPVYQPRVWTLVMDGKPVLDPNATGKTRNALYERVSLLAVS